MSEFKVLRTMSKDKFKREFCNNDLQIEKYQWTDTEGVRGPKGQTYTVRNLVSEGEKVGTVTTKKAPQDIVKPMVSLIQFEDGASRWVLHENASTNEVEMVL